MSVSGCGAGRRGCRARRSGVRAVMIAGRVSGANGEGGSVVGGLTGGEAHRFTATGAWCRGRYGGMDGRANGLAVTVAVAGGQVARRGGRSCRRRGVGLFGIIVIVAAVMPSRK